MIARVFALVVLLGALGMIIAQEGGAPSPGEPVRLKKKKAVTPENVQPPESTRKEDPPARGEKPAGGADAPPMEDEAEILARIGKNLKDVEDRLGSLEVGDATVQKQRDILEDLDKLLRNQQKDKDSKSKSREKKSQEQKKKSDKSQEEKERNQANKGKQDKSDAGKQKEGNKQGKDGSDKMAKGNPKGGDKDLKKGSPDGKKGGGETLYDLGPGGEMFKEIWGHLPETLRAELNAYGAPRQFMDRYDAMIRKYYIGVAQKGSKKK